MTDTTIRLTEATKDVLAEKKREGESFNDIVRRLADDSYGSVWTEDEIREIVRDEIQNVQTQY